ncbi:MAG: dethiobiotin synthase [Gammaproteobacteria bacterium RIFCSPLOWO2_02_FULL_47_50]|jgi:dethiobiotin synthetase|nr:MAG: dethiobiotin synthase [Gammaproteobacteria bacterium RIFCSPLOWO2_01_FULL_47_190]OGT75554.1 MAG: dethiobiotin synthase [Gammaproteobacteria bacterium RIFCSPLOWO2_12_47_11]OGT80217.1 MAG: dethiobiotin synthase [Gammaproteobacteria bacterium RIFCSPLOWO2_02_FULL_47_50]OGT86131.1 MAG: dethiobiotin synthase [Gammaproteobacteria bacterium RIFCSPLOWO2_12_FULL_47_76]
MTACSFFITGTDTGSGKTWFTLALMRAFQSRGMTVTGMKPIASGCEETVAGLRNADALSIQAQSSTANEYAVINPYAFRPPIAPHIAAAQAGTEIDINCITSAYTVLSKQNDVVIVEGIGGWRVPLTHGASLVDLVRALNLPVILVVGLRLGCINHTLLSAETIVSDGLNLAGWAACHINPSYLEFGRTLHTLAESVPAPLLGVLPYLQVFDVEVLARQINVDLLWPPACTGSP